MTFHGGFKEQILFDQWSTQTVGGEYQISLPFFLLFNYESLIFVSLISFYWILVSHFLRCGTLRRIKNRSRSSGKT